VRRLGGFYQSLYLNRREYPVGAVEDELKIRRRGLNNPKLQNGSYLKRQKMPKSYKTIEAKTHLNNQNLTKPFKAGFLQNRQKGKNITKPTVAKPSAGFLKLQNGSYLKTGNYKTNEMQKIIF
jgi:hypothetical protein